MGGQKSRWTIDGDPEQVGRRPPESDREPWRRSREEGSHGSALIVMRRSAGARWRTRRRGAAACVQRRRPRRTAVSGALTRAGTEATAGRAGQRGSATPCPSSTASTRCAAGTAIRTAAAAAAARVTRGLDHGWRASRRTVRSRRCSCSASRRERRSTRIRIFSDDCALDAGGLTLHWLTGVRAADSVASWPASLRPRHAHAGRRRALGAGACTAIRWRSIDCSPPPGRARRRRCAARRCSGWRSAPATRRSARSPTRSPTIRRPTSRRRAVFALSQLPKDDGVPLLIQVARTQQQPRRAQAGDVLARPVERSAGAEVLRRDSEIAARAGLVVASVACRLPVQHHGKRRRLRGASRHGEQKPFAIPRHIP